MNALRLADLQPTPRPGILHADFRALWLCRMCGARRWWYGEQVSPQLVQFYAEDAEHDPERCARCGYRKTCRMVAGVRLPPALDDVTPRRKGAIRAGWRIDL